MRLVLRIFGEVDLDRTGKAIVAIVFGFSGLVLAFIGHALAAASHRPAC
jgi:hypothetical protein